MAVTNTDMRGKTVLITGGTGGIGKATATGLANLGAAVLITGRDRSRGEAAVAEIRQQSGNQAVELLLADMSSQWGIRQLAQHVIDTYPRLDVLINNVGGLYAQRWETEDGIEATLAVTHLAPFLLTHALLPLLKASAPARIVNVTSSGHRYTKLDLNDLQSSKAYKGIEAYNRAKLVNLIVSYEFARRLAGTGVTLNLADPGGANTTMTNSAAAPWFFRTLMRVLPNLLTTEKAARSSIYLASSPEVASTSGTYFSPRMKAIRSSKASYDTDLVKQLWQISEELTGLHAKRDRDGVALEQFNVA